MRSRERISTSETWEVEGCCYRAVNRSGIIESGSRAGALHSRRRQQATVWKPSDALHGSTGTCNVR